MQTQIMQAKTRNQTEIHRTILSFSNIWIYIKVQYRRKYIYLFILGGTFMTVVVLYLEFIRAISMRITDLTSS